MRWLKLTLLLALPLPVSGQAIQTRLDLAGFAGGFGATTVADFDAGSRVSPSATGYTVTLVRGNQQRVTTVEISAASATFGSTKPIADLQWRRSDQTTWRPLSTGWETIESRTVQNQGTAWSNSVWFRTLLDWASDPPGNLSTTVTFRLLIAPP